MLPSVMRVERVVFDLCIADGMNVSPFCLLLHIRISFFEMIALL